MQECVINIFRYITLTALVFYFYDIDKIKAASVVQKQQVFVVHLLIHSLYFVPPIEIFTVVIAMNKSQLLWDLESIYSICYEAGSSAEEKGINKYRKDRKGRNLIFECQLC